MEGSGGGHVYTSDAADEVLCVDLGGRRSIKKKNLPKKSTLATSRDKTNKAEGIVV